MDENANDFALSVESSRWLDFAAYVTWLGLTILGGVVVLLDTQLPLLHRIVGAITGTATIGIGFRHLKLLLHSSRPRWLSIGAQTTGALVAINALREPTLAVLLIIIAGFGSESGDRRRTLLWLVVTNAVLLASFLGLVSTIQALISFSLFLGFQLFAIAMNNAVGSERRLREELSGVNAELLATRRLLQESARNQERLRISRELHDVAGHRLTALKLNLRAELERGGSSSERLSLCHDLSDELLGDIRSVVHQLRATDKIDVPSALALLKHQHPGLEIHLDVVSGLKIDGIEVAEAIVRSAQEAITNALKHGRARSVWITLGQNADGITLSVEDDGIGGVSKDGGQGLVGMSERAGLLGGTLKVEQFPDRGWTLRLFLPRELSK